jgi:hypothetical protein
MRVPPNIEVTIGITAALIIPANAPRPDITPNAAPNEMAGKLTVSPAVISGINRLMNMNRCEINSQKIDS